MDPAIATRIQEWDARPVSSGYRGLQELAGEGFSGSVTTGTAWLFLLNGRIVGVVDGTLSGFESADLTAYEAPDPTLPLLFAMQERGGETQAKYYTDDSPLPDVHSTLTDAGFTGYLELSENVLSGDYYVVYYGGKSMSAAFVGNSGNLITGDEAFGQAADEVGIYEVIAVDLDVRDVPEPASAEPAEPAEPVEPVEQDPATPVEDDPGTEPEPPAAEPSAPSAAEDVESEPEPADTIAAPDDPPPAAESVGSSAEEGSTSPPAGAGNPTPEAAEPSTADADAGETDDPFTQEAAWRETRTIPALDPDETDGASAAGDGGQQQPAPAVTEPAPEPSGEPAGEDDRLAELEAAIEAQSATIADLESKLESTSTQADRLRQERDNLRAQLAAVSEGGDAGDVAAAPESLDAESALDQTDLFVRYGTKAGGTLEKAHDGVIDREEVVENLRIDHHTRFEENAVSVEGQPFRTFLAESLEYRFVTWLITEFLFEIQDTGSQAGLRDLFDVLPLVDRVEFHGTVTWRDQDEGETISEDFDVVCRDRMGQALIVANLNDVRDPATGEMMEALIEGTSTIASGVETLGGALLVTSSFFQPDALETAANATGGGLLSRDKRWSYVKLGRRHGFHLCLVEARGDDFHVAVPEL